MQLNCNSSTAATEQLSEHSSFASSDSINCEFAFDFALNINEWSLKSPEEWEPIEVAQWIRCWALNNGVADIDIAHLLYTPVSGFDLCRLERNFFTAICPQFGAAIFDSLHSLLAQYRNLNCNSFCNSQLHSINALSNPSPPLSSSSVSSSHFCFPSAFPGFDLISSPNASLACLSDLDSLSLSATADGITLTTNGNGNGHTHNHNSSSPCPSAASSPVSSSPSSVSSPSTSSTTTTLTPLSCGAVEFSPSLVNVCDAFASMSQCNPSMHSHSHSHSHSRLSLPQSHLSSSSSPPSESDRESTSSALSSVNERKPNISITAMQSQLLPQFNSGQSSANHFTATNHYFCPPIADDNLSVTSATVASSAANGVKRAAGRRGRPPKKDAKSRNKGNGKLWEFIRDLLLSPQTNPSFIRWERREEGIFKFVQSDRVAKMWGQRKQNPRMTYEKLSRAMRYYYKSAVLLPVFGRRLVYKFGPNATGWRPNTTQPQVTTQVTTTTQQ